MVRASATVCAGLGLAVVVLAGCGAGGPRLHPVTGSVLHGGRPAEGATVVFHPRNAARDAPTPSGTVRADGSFALSTGPRAGAPAGEYAVVVTWYPADARGQADPENRLPPRYADPAQTPLNATVRDGPNPLAPFQLPAR